MIILNKKLLITIILLTSIYIISFLKQETNFIMPKNNVIDYDYNFVDIDYNNQQFKITLQDYIIGVVAGEMPALFSEEALKAQETAQNLFENGNINTENMPKGIRNGFTMISLGIPIWHGTKIFLR